VVNGSALHCEKRLELGKAAEHPTDLTFSQRVANAISDWPFDYSGFPRTGDFFKRRESFY
jgi:hypothetical protein